VAIKGIHIQTHGVIGRIYEMCHLDGFRCHDIHTKFHNNWSRHSKAAGGGGHTDTQYGDGISLILFV
jgi:hypothetical protein